MSRMSVDGAACQSRRERLTDALNRQGLTAALLLRPQHLTYFFGLSGWRSQPAAGFITSDGSNVLALGASTDCSYVAENVVRFEDSYFKTTIEDRDVDGQGVQASLRGVCAQQNHAQGPPQRFGQSCCHIADGAADEVVQPDVRQVALRGRPGSGPPASPDPSPRPPWPRARLTCRSRPARRRRPRRPRRRPVGRVPGPAHECVRLSSSRLTRSGAPLTP